MVTEPLIPSGLSPELPAAENRRIIQTAIDEAASRGGGVVVVPAGRFPIGGITLRSGVTLRLAEGAVLLGSDREEDYDKHFIEHFSTPGGSRFYCALIYAEDCEHIAIEGPGTIDGQGGAEAWRCYPIPGGNGAWHKPPRPWGIRLWKCRQVRLEGYRLQASAEWGHHLCDCEHLTVRGLDIFNHANANNDGLDLDGCREVLIEDCRIDADDDAFCIKSTGFRVNRNIHLRHCVLASRCRIIHLGSESSGPIENVLIEKCSLVRTKARQKVDANRSDEAAHAISIESMEGSVIRNLRFADLTIEGCHTAFFVHLGFHGPDRPKYAGHVLKPGRIENLHFSRLSGRLASPVASSFTAAEGLPPLQGLHFSNLHFQVPGNPAPDSQEVSGVQVSWEPRAFGSDLPARGLYFNNVTGITLEKLSFHPANPDPRPEVVVS